MSFFLFVGALMHPCLVSPVPAQGLARLGHSSWQGSRYSPGRHRCCTRCSARPALPLLSPSCLSRLHTYFPVKASLFGVCVGLRSPLCWELLPLGSSVPPRAEFFTHLSLRRGPGRCWWNCRPPATRVPMRDRLVPSFNRQKGKLRPKGASGLLRSHS